MTMEVKPKLEDILSCEEIPIIKLISYEINTFVMGYHVYKSNWTPSVGDEFHGFMEPTNKMDKYAVAVRKNDGEVIGAFSLSIGPLIGIFSIRNISNHLWTALLTCSNFSGLTRFDICPLLNCLNIFSLFFFQVDNVLLGTLNMAATSFGAVPFSNSLRALYLILQDLL